MKLYLRLTLLSLFFLAQSQLSNAQSIVIQEGDTIFLCEPGPVTLHAQFVGVDSSNLQSSQPLNNIDDIYSGIINIGFPFTFYGNTYTQCLLSTNDYITFDLSGANGYSQWPISAPLPSSSDPMNSIMGPWEDLYPGAGAVPGWVSYTSFGTAPNRIFVFNMCLIPMFSCTSQYFSGQILLYESTNNIEYHIAHKEVCSTWNGGKAVLGVQNATGTLATTVPGNNATQWTADNLAYRFTPNATGGYDWAAIPYDPVQVYATNQLQWHWQNDPAVYSDTIVINVTQSGWAHVDFFGCFGATLTNAGSDSIYIALNYSDYTQSQRVSACNDTADNALFIHFPTNVNGPYDLVWTDATGNILDSATNVLDIDSLAGLPAGIYHLGITNAIGCTFLYDYTLPVHTMMPSFTSSPALICQGSSVTFTNTSTGSIDRYFWHLGDNDTSQIANPIHSFYETGDSVLVVMTISNDTFASCVFSDTAYLQVHPNIVASAILDSPRCVGQYVHFRDMSEPYPVAWQWFEGDSLISIDSTAKMIHNVEGAYPLSLIVTDSLCGVDTLNNLIFINHFPIVDIGNDTLLCPGESIELDAGNPGNEYTWSNGMNTQTVIITPSQTITVNVDVNNMGCHSFDDILITMNCSMIFPNAFSPNGDGTNDNFRPHLINVKSYHFFIYNRWGQLMYSSIESGDTDKGWDGTFHNERAPVASYVFYAEGIDIKDQPVKAQGTFTLLR